MEYIRISAKTVDDAITEASIQLGTSSDNIEYEVVEKGSTGFLGFGSRSQSSKRACLQGSSTGKRAGSRETGEGSAG